MALDRADLITAVAGELAGVLALAGLTAVDDAPNMKGPLDRTFRALGVAEDDLAAAVVTDGAEAQALAYATYFVLARALDALVDRNDVSAGKVSAKEHQQFENVRERMMAAGAEAQRLGLPIVLPGMGGIAPIPYIGGVDAADYASNAANTDRVPSLFRAWT